MYTAVWNYKCFVPDKLMFVKDPENVELDLLGRKKTVFLLVWTKLSWTVFKRQIVLPNWQNQLSKKRGLFKPRMHDFARKYFERYDVSQ